MILNYYKEPNFGDALNPLIFNKLMPGFFNDDPSIEFTAIGSTIGLEMHAEAKRRIIFSSGFAYGKLPFIDDSFDIICVRGPLTAKALNISNSLAITDGAALLKEVIKEKPKKEYSFSFMPHWESELKYPAWKDLCAEAGIHYLSPTDDPLITIDSILKSEVVIAEAMHAAIVADTLRVPWIPVKAYQGINDFKWNDWTKSLGMEYRPNSLKSMYQVNDFVIKVFKEKSKNRLPDFAYKPIAYLYTSVQDIFMKSTILKQLNELKKREAFLSDEYILNEKVSQLLERLEYVKKKYG
jgi:succinoglycan biosynthesis protein ExoV